MTWQKLLPSVRNDLVQFGTMRPPGSPFVTLERRVFVIAPPELAELAATGDPAVLDALVPLLQDPRRAWAAEVLLAAMTRNEEKIVDAWSARPDEWWDALGQGAQARWQAWLNERRGKLVWDEAERYFREAR
jgi:hypothetical protein